MLHSKEPDRNLTSEPNVGMLHFQETDFDNPRFRECELLWESQIPQTKLPLTKMAFLSHFALTQLYLMHKTNLF